MVGSYTDDLRSVEILALAEESTLQELGSRIRWRTYPSGHVLASPESDAPEVWVVGSGTVRVYRLTEQGQQVAIARVGPGQVCGLLAGLTAGREHTNFVETSTNETRIGHVPAKAFRELLQKQPELVGAIYDKLLSGLHAAHDQIEHLATQSVRDRLLAVLVARAAESCDSTVRITHQDLAPELGTTREQVTRALAQLRREGLVVSARHDRAIYLRDAVAQAAD